MSKIFSLDSSALMEYSNDVEQRNIKEYENDKKM